MDSCTYLENETNGYGGSGIMTFNSTYTANATTFDGNVAPQGGGGIYLGDSTEATFTACVFKSNHALFGGGILDFSSALDYGMVNRFFDCEFSNNVSTRGGGGAGNGFNANTEFDNCIFNRNSGGWGAGIFSQNDFTTVTVRNTEFTNNLTTDEQIGQGGGFFGGSGGVYSFTDCNFASNEAIGFGGAISVTEDSLDTGILTLENISFTFNVSQGNQGGALNVGNFEVMATNCLMLNNAALGENNDTPPGRGGAISNNASRNLLVGQYVSDTSRITLINCTLSDNEGVTGNNFVQFEDTSAANAIIILQNTIVSTLDFLFEDNPNYAVENPDDATPTVISRGGNISTDATLAFALTEGTDFNETDPMFVDPFTDLTPAMGSPAINAGVEEGAPTTDLNGEERCGQIDIGAIEFIPAGGCTIVGTVDLVDNTALTVAPNPVRDITTVNLENNWSGEWKVVVTNALGQ